MRLSIITGWEGPPPVEEEGPESSGRSHRSCVRQPFRELPHAPLWGRVVRDRACTEPQALLFNLGSESGVEQDRRTERNRLTQKQTPIAALALTAASLLQGDVVTEGLVLHYDFTADSAPGEDGVVTDLSGSGIDGVMRPTNASVQSKRTGWLEHRILQGDGKGGWIARPAKMQMLRKPRGKSTIPYGIVRMENGEIALACSWHDGKSERPVVAFSKDGGDNWTEFHAIPGAAGRPMNLTYLGRGKLTFRANKRFFSSDYGRTWPESQVPCKTSDGRPFSQEGNAWVDFGDSGNAERVAELGWHYKEGKWPTGAAVTVIRWSTDGGRTWHDEVHPKSWVYETEHAGKTYRRGVSEGALVRAANGWLVAAVRTDMPPRFFNVPHSDHFEGTGVSISKDDGKTWSELTWLYDAGRMHANLQRRPNGELVMTYIVRQDVVTETMGEYASFRRGCEALVSRDHGRTWDLTRPYILYAFEYPDPAGRYPVVCGHIGAAVLEDGSVLSACGDYPRGTSVLVKWTPDAGPAQPAEPGDNTTHGVGPSVYDQVAQHGEDYQVDDRGLALDGRAWIHLPNDDRLAVLDEGTIELVFHPQQQGGMPVMVACRGSAADKPVHGFTLAYDQRGTNPNQVVFSDQRIEKPQMAYSVQVHAGSEPNPLGWELQQLAYVVEDGHGRFYRDGVPFSNQTETRKSAAGSLLKYTFDEVGGKQGVCIAIGASPEGSSPRSGLHARILAVRLYDRALTPPELGRNRAAVTGANR